MSDIYNPGIIRLTSNNGTIIFVPSDGEGGVVDLSTAGGGGGTVTEIFTGLGLTGGPITTTGTVSIANQTAYSLAGYLNSGVFGNITIGTGLNINGAGVLNSLDNPGGTFPEMQYNNNGTFGGSTMYYDSTNGWFGFNINPPECTLDVYNTQSIGSGANTAGRFQADGGNYNLTLADAADGAAGLFNSPSYYAQICYETGASGLNIGQNGGGSLAQFIYNGTILTANDASGNSMVLGGGAGSAQLTNTYGQGVFLGFPGFASGYFYDPNGNSATLADGTEAANFSDSNGNQVLIANNSYALQLNPSGSNAGLLNNGASILNGPILDPTFSPGLATQVPIADGTSWAWGYPSGGGTPGGAQYDVQINDGSGGFYGDSGLTYNYATGAFNTVHNTVDDGTGASTWNGAAFFNNHLYSYGISVESGGLTMVSGFSANPMLLSRGYAAVGGAPLYFNSTGSLLTTPANGAMEFDGTNLYITISGARKTVVVV